MSSETVVEIANWTASEAYKADPSIIHPALELIAATKGALKIWHGLHQEDKSTAYLVIAWETLAEHEALIADPDAYGKLGAALTPSLGGPLSLVHAKFNPVAIPEEHLNAPITEFAMQIVREGKDKAELEAIVWNPELNAQGKAFNVGKIVEKENQYVLAKGWDTVEAPRAAVANDEHIKKFVTILNELTVPTASFVKLTQFK